MVPALTSIMQLNDPQEYVFPMDRMYTGRSDIAAQQNDRTLEMPERQSLASTRFQIASPNQLCDYRVALGATGNLEDARYLFAKQVAQYFKDAVELGTHSWALPRKFCSTQLVSTFQRLKTS